MENRLVWIKNGDFEILLDLGIATGIKRGTNPWNGTPGWFPITLKNWKSIMTYLATGGYRGNADAVYKIPDILQDVHRQQEEALNTAKTAYVNGWKDPEYYYNHNGDERVRLALKSRNERLKKAVKKAEREKAHTEKMLSIFHNIVE